ncbi:MAG: thermonuclease family protein [Patescibacteria group bacterium]|jgi:micrococcal nuclease
MRNWIRQTGVYLIGVVIIVLLLANLLNNRQIKANTASSGSNSSQITTDTNKDEASESAEADDGTVASAQTGESETDKDLTLYDVTSIIDGDTVKINFDGKTESVRLIGIDSEELSSTDQKQKCFANLAKSEADKMLKGKKIKLESDPVSGERDKYNRLLGYIFVDETNFNQYMVENGFAHEYTYSNQNYKYRAEFKSAESRAKSTSKGLWSSNICVASAVAPAQQTEAAPSTVSQNNSAATPAEPTKPEKVVEPTPPADPPPGCLIKGNISSSGKIYHVPGGSFYDRTKISEPGEHWFCSEEEAVAAGWRKSSR